MEDEIHGLLLTGKSEGAFSRQSVVRINVHVIRVFTYCRLGREYQLSIASLFRRRQGESQ